MEKLTIDRFEENYAVCETENEEFVNVLKSEIFGKVCEGDIIVKVENGYVKDIDETEKAKERIKAKMNRLFNR